MAKYLITNAIPYVNADPHVGHALEFVQSDTIARYHRLLGEDVTLVCGSDENAIKNVQAAEKDGVPIQKFIDDHALLFEDAAKKLNVEFDIFQKGSSANHHSASQKLWELCEKNGDIYKKKYKGLYCVGCEEFKITSDLVNGECPEHPGKTLEEVEEENYFFKLSRYKDQLIEIVTSNTYEIVPGFRKNEVLQFLKGELLDFSISRSNERAKNWGVPVPNDPTQRIYVWFDALNIYQSGIGFGSDEEKYNKLWPADLHVIGKGIIRFHAVYWPAILLSAGLKLPKKLFVHEYFTVNGQKMSKTLGNVINPIDLVEKYGADALRYFFLAKFSPFSDSDFSVEKFAEVYNADLANGLGNLTSRVAKLCENANFSNTDKYDISAFENEKEYHDFLKEFRFNDALSLIWKRIAVLDGYINEKKPWELLKQEDPNLQSVLLHCVRHIQEISYLLRPFLPETAEKIDEQFNDPLIKAGAGLFPRLQ